jgi:hypothetical protein
MSETPRITPFCSIRSACEPSPRHIEKRGPVAHVWQFLCNFDATIRVEP